MGCIVSIPEPPLYGIEVNFKGVSNLIENGECRNHQEALWAVVIKVVVQKGFPIADLVNLQKAIKNCKCKSQDNTNCTDPILQSDNLSYVDVYKICETIQYLLDIALGITPKNQKMPPKFDIAVAILVLASHDKQKIKILASDKELISDILAKWRDIEMERWYGNDIVFYYKQK